MIGYHWTGDKLRDGQPLPAIGQKLVFGGEIEICRSGYHWSETPWQALQYAPGPILHRVECSPPENSHENDKHVSRERTILASIDATDLCRRFAADQALSVSHLWDMPPVVKDYLVSLDEAVRAAAWAAAEAAARDAAGEAAWAAAWAAARDVARAAAGEAAGEAAWAAAGAAARADFNARCLAAFDDLEADK